MAAIPLRSGAAAMHHQRAESTQCCARGQMIRLAAGEPREVSEASTSYNGKSVESSRPRPVEAIVAEATVIATGRRSRWLNGLSNRTRRFYSVNDPVTEARGRCAGIARYDKLCLLLRDEGSLVALVEFSFDLVDTDIERFQQYGVTLHPGRDCRWGLCVSDEWQGRGVGTALAAPSFDVARRFGRDRVILWGGVQAANAAAIHYYDSVGFTEVGQFTDDAGVESMDMLRSLAEP